MSVIKSKNDDREYDYMTLSNGLTVFMISDLDTKIASASMTVNVGNYSDPEGYEGLAHFLEHMLFQGSFKYPNTNTYNEFLNENGGSSNAFTACEITLYYFDVVADKFDKALDIFSRFFIDPTFNKENVFNEMNAVNSEHSKNINSDGWRSRRMAELLVCGKHPMKNFGCGTLESLQKDDIRDVLLKFHKEHYRPKDMKLVVQWNKPIEFIKRTVENIFSDLKGSNSVLTDYKSFDKVLNKIKLGRTNEKSKLKQFKYSNLKPLNFKRTPFAIMEPIDDMNILTIIWQLPDLRDKYKLKAIEYISFLLGHEGINTLAYNLKKLGLIINLNVGEWETDSTGTLFSLELKLSDSGIKYIKEIVDMVYNYIELITSKSLDSSKYYDEQKKINYINFDFIEKVEPSVYTQFIGSVLHFVKPIDALAFPYMYEDFSSESKKLISDCLKCMTRKNSIIIFNSPINKESLDSDNKVDKYYGFRYKKKCYEKLFSSSSLTNEFNDMLDKKRITIDLPRLNLFIDKIDTTLLNCSDGHIIEGTLKHDYYPNILKEDLKHSIWYKCDDKFKIPSSISSYFIYNDTIFENSMNYAICNLYILLIDKLLEPILYDAKICSSFIRVGLKGDRINILLNCRSGLELELLGLYLKTFLKGIDEQDDYNDLFEMLKNEIIKGLENHKLSPPYELCSYYMLSKSCIKCFSNEELLESFKKVKVEDMKKVPKMFLKKCYYTSLIQGNLGKDVALSIDDMMGFFVNCSNDKKPPEMTMTDRIVSLGKGEYRVAHNDVLYNPMDNDSAIKIIFEIENINKVRTRDWDKLICSLIFIDKLISEKFFNELRTKQQLGYIVRCGMDYIGDDIEPLYHEYMLIQSPVLNPDELENKIMEFIQSIVIDDREEFQAIKETSIYQLGQGDIHVMEEFSRNFKAILGKDFKFNIKELMIDCIIKITMDEVIQYFNKYFLNKQTRKIRVVKLWSQKESSKKN